MKHTPEGLLNCARIAYPEYEWFISSTGLVCRNLPGDPLPRSNIHESTEHIAEFYLDNDSDVLALWKNLYDHGISIFKKYKTKKWVYQKVVVEYGTEIVRLIPDEYNTLTDCLYAAAQEVGE